MAARLAATDPDRVPVIVSTTGVRLRANKLLAARTQTYGEFLRCLREKHVEGLRPSDALFVFTSGGSLPTSTCTMGALHARHQDADGFLRLHVSAESTFG